MPTESICCPRMLELEAHLDSKLRRLLELNDPALHMIIRGAGNEELREHAIGEVVSVLARPFLAMIIARFQRQERLLRSDDSEELSSVIMLRIIKKLRAVAYFEEHAIGVFESYMAIVACNSLHDFRRERYPERYRLKRALRYVLTHDKRLALWERDIAPVAGLAAWEDRTDVKTGLDFAGYMVGPAMTNSARPAEAVAAILQAVGAPVAFDALVSTVAALWNVRDVVMAYSESHRDPRRDQLTVIEQRQHLSILWKEIQQLPERQRAALLLNLRDRANSNVLMLFLLLEITTEEQLAATIGMSTAELRALWEHLPLDDLSIASRLDLTRQQVINLRKAARTRLGRRMARVR